MNIRNRAEHDPVADMGLPNSYMRWALEAIEEVAGKPGLTIPRLPPEQLRPPPPEFQGFPASLARAGDSNRSPDWLWPRLNKTGPAALPNDDSRPLFFQGVERWPVRLAQVSRNKFEN